MSAKTCNRVNPAGSSCTWRRRSTSWTPPTFLRLVRDGFLIHLYQEGEEVLEPGELTPTRPVVKTGTAHLDYGGEMVRISLFGHRDRVWVTVPDWLLGLYLGTAAIAPVRELLPVEAETP
ncbi:MAG: hypothetical protein QMD46_12210 [Methanomicrobiales archaeon]|nr:hypothetical protein [Methanomicrobiales archaeon]